MQQVDKDNINKLAQRIKGLRFKQSKSLNKFVLTKGHLTGATWSRLENGKFDCKISTLLRASYMLGMDIKELLDTIDFDYNFTEE